MPYIWFAGIVYFGIHDQTVFALVWCVAWALSISILQVLAPAISVVIELMESMHGTDGEILQHALILEHAACQDNKWS